MAAIKNSLKKCEMYESNLNADEVYKRILNPGGEVLLYMVYIGICAPKGYGFSAVLVINRVWFLHSCLECWAFF